MDFELIKAKLIDVLEKIQHAGGYEAGAIINENVVPLDALEGFDSKVAPIATRRLAHELEIDIPMNHNIFRECGQSAGRKLTVAEIAAELAAKTLRITNIQAAK